MESITFQLASYDNNEAQMNRVMASCFFYYYNLKLFRGNIKIDLDECGGPNPKHDDRLFVTISGATLKRE